MSLIVEDGSIVENANTYVSLADARAILESRGLVLSGNDTTDTAALLRAMDWLESKRGLYAGMKVEMDQPLQWPRASVFLDGYAFPDDEIPNILIVAQCLLAVEALTNPLFVNRTGERILMEKVDVLETRYSNSSSTKAQPFFAAVEALINPLLKIQFGGLPTRRV